MNTNIDVHSRRSIAEFPGDWVKCISKLQSHFANMTFADKSIYGRLFHQVTHKGEESVMNYIKRYQNSQALSISVGNSYSEDQLINIWLDKILQGGRYTTQLSSHQAELRREAKLSDQKALSITSLQTEYLNLASSSGYEGNNKTENLVQTIFTFCGGANHSVDFLR